MIKVRLLVDKNSDAEKIYARFSNSVRKIAILKNLFWLITIANRKRDPIEAFLAVIRAAIKKFEIFWLSEKYYFDFCSIFEVNKLANCNSLQSPVELLSI